jgi:hypothetical protein
MKVWACQMTLSPGLALAVGADRFPQEVFTGQYRMTGAGPQVESVAKWSQSGLGSARSDIYLGDIGFRGL